MKPLTRKLFTALLILLPFLEAKADDLTTLLLTWQRDPSTTMTVQWIRTSNRPATRQLHFWKEGEEATQTVKVPSKALKAWRGHRLHRVELTGLEPDTTYRFRVHKSEREFAFRTLPKTLSRPLRIAVGGDTLHRREWMDAVNQQVLKHDVDFVVIGGDLAYADGLERNLSRWDTWFESLHETLIYPDGRLLPMVVAIGNHEVQGGYFFSHATYENSDKWRERVAPYFYQLFAFPGHPGYNVLDFGDYLSLFMLDTDHSHPIEGQQTEWLKEALAERAGGKRHLIPVYHVPGWPSHRPFDGRVSARVRENWVPLFERFDVQVAFENHDHTYKRTEPIRNEAIDPERGIIYVGDGAWGVGTRPTHDPDETWYLKRAESEHHFILMTLNPNGSLDFKAIRKEGDTIDSWEIP